MKPRRIVVTLEIQTDIPLNALRKSSSWRYMLGHLNRIRVMQAQANVVKREKT